MGNHYKVQSFPVVEGRDTRSANGWEVETVVSQSKGGRVGGQSGRYCSAKG